jgi:hypothetical protein
MNYHSKNNDSCVDNSSEIIQQPKLRDLPPGLAPLIALEHWVVWRWALNSQRKLTKIPYQARNPDGEPARSNNPSTWADHDSACKAVEAGKANGIGFVLTDTPFAAFDLDDCFIEGATDSDWEISPWALQHGDSERNAQGWDLTNCCCGSIEMPFRHTEVVGLRG